MSPRKRYKPAPKVVFEPNVEKPRTVESLAEQQRKFLAANQREWADVDLQERFQKEDIEWALQLKAKRELPAESKQRYRELRQKRREERLTESEHAELLRFTNESEMKRAEELEALAELARLRNMSLRELMDILGIKPPDVEG